MKRVRQLSPTITSKVQTGLIQKRIIPDEIPSLTKTKRNQKNGFNFFKH